MVLDVGAAHERHEVVAGEDVGANRRRVAHLTAADRRVSGRAALIVTELATNLARHTDAGGYVLIRRLAGGVELVAVDHGPGLDADVVAHPDQVSSNGGRIRPRGGDPVAAEGGLGIGLSGVVRMADAFDVYSIPGAGTVALARVGSGGPTLGRWRWGAVNVPFPGQGCSGDGWAVAADDRLAVVVVDGLGHGEAAAAASAAALAELREDRVADVIGFVQRAHDAMIGTRGAVLSAAAVDPGSGQVVCAGVGNVLAHLYQGAARVTLVPRDGTVGTSLQAPVLHPRGTQWSPGAVLVLASDGLRSDWDPRKYPGLLGRDPTVVAAVLHRDYTRGTDDATVVDADAPPPRAGPPPWARPPSWAASPPPGGRSPAASSDPPSRGRPG